MSDIKKGEGDTSIQLLRLITVAFWYNNVYMYKDEKRKEKRDILLKDLDFFFFLGVL